jgi:predicted dinucleotide-binding enzyme
MRIAIIGAGHVGDAQGAAWARAGQLITYGVRDPAAPKVKQALAATGPNATATTNDKAATNAEVILLATPWPATRDAIASCGDLRGKVVIDATNPLNAGPAGLQLALGHTTSGGEQVQQWASGASVFKTFNQTGAPHMANADFGGRRPVMFVAGDDASRKLVVMKLVEEVGFDAVDAGNLATSRLLEPLAMLWIHLALNQGMGTGFAYALLKH